MRIGLLSDTHIPEAAKALPPQIREVFRGVELILHAGDIYETWVLDELETIAPVLAALGDDDGSSVACDDRVKHRHTLSLDEITLWLTHVRPSYWDVGPQQEVDAINALQREADAINALRQEPDAIHARPPDIIVFGHSHLVTVHNSQGVLSLNPGSPTFPNYRRELGTVGMLTIEDGTVDPRIVQLE